MIALLTFCICVSLSCVAVHIAITWPGMLLYGLAKRLEFLPDLIKKPFYDCLNCMGGIYSVVYWFATGQPLQWQLLWAMLITVGINTIICAWLNTVTDHGC